MTWAESKGKKRSEPLLRHDKVKSSYCSLQRRDIEGDVKDIKDENHYTILVIVPFIMIKSMNTKRSM